MADTNENIVISVTDSVAPTIATKLQTMENNALKAMDAFTRMQKSIDNISADKMQAVPTSLRAIAAALKVAQSASQAFEVAQARLGRVVERVTGTIVKQTAALMSLSTVLASSTSAAALTTIATSALQNASSGAAGALNGAAAGAKNMAGGGFLASSSIKFMSGNMNAGALSAGRFLMSIQALQPVLMAAFTVVGLVALITMIGVGIYKLFEMSKAAQDVGEQIKNAWQKAGDEVMHQNDQLILENSKLEQQLANLNKKPGSNEIVIFFNDAMVAADKMIESIDNAMERWNKLVNEKSVSKGQEFISGQAATGDTQTFLANNYRSVAAARDQMDESVRAAQTQQAADEANKSLKGSDRIRQLKADTEALNKAREDGTAKYIAALKTLQGQISVYDGQLTELQKKHNDPSLAPRSVGTSSMGAPVYTQDQRPADQSTNLTLLGSAYKQLTTDMQNASLQNTNAGLIPQVNALKDKLKETGLAAKEAKAQIKAYDEQLKTLESTLKGNRGTDVAQAQTALDFWKNKQGSSATLPAAQDEVATKISEAQDHLTEAVNKQSTAVSKLRSEYAAEVAESKLYNDELEEYKKNQAIVNRLLDEGIDPLSATGQELLKLGKQAADAAEHHKDLAKALNSITAPQDEYKASVEAAIMLLDNGSISLQQYSGLIDRAREAYSRAIDPMTKFNEKMTEQRKLAGLAGPQLTVQKGVNELDQQTRDNSRFGTGLNASQKSDAAAQLTAMEQQAMVQSKLESIYKSSAGAIRDLAAQQAALNIAMKNGYMTQQQYNNAMIQNKANIANARLEAGVYSNVLRDMGNSVLGKLMADFKSLGSSITNALGNAAKQALDGVANTLARLIVYGGSVKKAFAELGRQIAESIISALIKIGIQELISVTLGKAMMAASLATMAPMAAAAAAMWAPAAVAASVATLGAADATGSAAYTASLAAGSAMTVGMSAAGFAANGAYVGYDSTFPGGPRGTDVYPYWLTKGEMVMNPESTRRNLPTLQAIQEGRSVPGNVGAMGGSNLKVSVVHDGSTAIQVVQGASHDEVRVIAQNIARQTLNNEGPRVIAADLQNPNSHTSKAVTRTTYAGRRRD